ncbi:MAG: family 43 glycosylhydrolase, partial [Erysipelotrichales bacterium]|nr:family 43 glycosylhydrolase [Erysipelotrichales bacterium]
MKYFCNPVNIDYRYQFNMDPRVGKLQVCREAADPSMILFQGKYYIFASMQLKVWVSEDLAHWVSYPLPEELPLYDYAPDVCVCGEYVYFCASRREEICDYYRTKDVINGPYEKLEGTFPFWDPHVFRDDDGKMYFYWGCSNVTPIYGVEVDPDTMKPLGKKRELIHGHPFEFGFERVGYDNSRLPRSEEEIEQMYQGFVKKQGIPESHLPAHLKPLIRGMFSDKPYIEGAWMTKYEGRYYLQYAAPGTQYNTYGDGVYVADSPLGPFEPAANNPYSYKPGGFMTGAGHGSTLKDKQGRFWHTSTMQISSNHDFERRVGLWRAGFDKDGELYCNQRFGDWPVNAETEDPWAEPEWMLLSYGKQMTASSYFPGNNPADASDENARTWWRASSNKPGEWLECDLGEPMEVHAVQINFADDKITDQKPAGEIRGTSQARWIDDRPHRTRW